MSKEICAICGTSYPDSLDQCPVCGCSKEMNYLDFSDDILMGEDGEIFNEESPKKNRTIFDYDQVNRVGDPEPDLDFDEDFDEEPEEEERSNTGLVVILVILIVLLLAAAGFIFLRYFMPNMIPKETAPTVAATVPVETETQPIVVDDSVPCTDIVVPGGKIELVTGGKWLMNVQVFPENTTDSLVYVSADDTIATVTEDGTVTAVGEGQTVIIVTCGKASVKCNVVVDNALEEETVSDATIPTMQAEQTQPAEVGEDQPTEETQAEQTQPEETTAATIPEGEVLKLKKTDITIFARYTSVTLELDCQIPAESITWFTMDSSVAIVNNGVVTATGSGITRIHGEYNGQKVECIVRCNF